MGLLNRRSFIACNAGLAASSLLPGRSYPAASELSRIQVLAERARAELKAPALACGVIRDGRVLTTFGLGSAAEGASGPAGIFNFGTTVRLFMAAALAQQAERGRLRFEQPVMELLPQWRSRDARAKSLTIEHILTSTSGLPEANDPSREPVSHSDTALREYVAALADVSFIFEPGKGFAVSGMGYALLARIIEILDGVPFETSIQRSILQPLRMRRSSLVHQEQQQAVPAPHVVDEGGNAVPSEFHYERPLVPSSMMLSCVDDMVRWVLANLNDGELDGTRIMSAEAMRALRTPRPIDITTPGFPRGVKPALSWYVLPRDGREIVAQGNSKNGFNSLCLFCARERFGLVAVANASFVRGPDTLRTFALAAIDEGLLSPTSV